MHNNPFTQESASRLSGTIHASWLLGQESSPPRASARPLIKAEGSKKPGAPIRALACCWLPPPLHISGPCFHVRGRYPTVWALNWIFITHFSRGSIMLFTCLSDRLLQQRAKSACLMIWRQTPLPKDIFKLKAWNQVLDCQKQRSSSRPSDTNSNFHLGMPGLFSLLLLIILSQRSGTRGTLSSFSNDNISALFTCHLGRSRKKKKLTW